MSDPGLNVERNGSGPPVVLLHGFTGSIRSWDSVRAHLVDSCTVIAVDLPGHGESPAPDDPSSYALPAVAGMILAVLDAHAIPRAVIVGYSMGGRTALRFALSHPDRCAALVLESTSPGIRDDAERAARREQDEALARLLEEEGLRAFVRRWEQQPLWASQMRLDPETIARQREIRLSQHPAGLAASLRGAGAGVAPALTDAELATLDMPALLLAGALDQRYVAHARAMAALMPHARVYIEPEAGHALHLERPMRVASLVNRLTHTLAL